VRDVITSFETLSRKMGNDVNKKNF